MAREHTVFEGPGVGRGNTIWQRTRRPAPCSHYLGRGGSGKAGAKHVCGCSLRHTSFTVGFGLCAKKTDGD